MVQPANKRGAAWLTAPCSRELGTSEGSGRHQSKGQIITELSSLVYLKEKEALESAYNKDKKFSTRFNRAELGAGHLAQW